MLETVPSFSIFSTTSSGCQDDDEKKGQHVDQDESGEESLERTTTIGDSIKEAAAGNEDFSFGNNTMGLIGEGEEKEQEETCPTEEAAPISSGGSNESKGTLSGADFEDGEILLRNAKLAWELHHDQGRALHYFERAAESSPENSDVLAAYACFLWEIGDGEEGSAGKEDQIQAEIEKQVDPHVEAEAGPQEEKSDKRCHFPTGLRDDIADSDENNVSEGGNIEEYYRKTVERYPSDPFILGKYAKFLYESKGDIQGAEEYYSRACLADPTDGEILAAYAKLAWQLYRDNDKASSYLERAVQASPEDSTILAAYASFLWDTEKDDPDVDCLEKSNHQNGAISTQNA